MKQQQPIRIAGVPEHFNLPWKHAIETGAFAKEGLQVLYRDEPGGTGAMTRGLREDNLDVAILLTEGIIADILRGNPSKIISTYIQSPLIWGIHVPASGRIRSVEEIRSFPYAISRYGSGSHLMAIVDACQRGWDPQELRFIQVGNLEGARESMAAGNSQVFFWERFMTQPYVDSGEFHRVGETRTPWPCFMIAAREEIIETREKDLLLLMNILNKEVRQLTDSTDAATMISDRYALRPDQVHQWLTLTEWNTDILPDPEIFPPTIQALMDAGIITEEQQRSADDFIHHLI